MMVLSPSLGQRLAVLFLLCCICQQDACAIDPEEEARQAQQQANQAIERRQWALAEQWLERSLMYQPDNAEARIDLARILARRGSWGAANALVKGLIDDPRTPESMQPGLRTIIQHYQQAQQAVASTNNQQQTDIHASALSVEIYAGRANNPSARTSSNSLQLSTSSGVLELPLQERPQPGWVQGAGLLWRPWRNTQLSTQFRHTPGDTQSSHYSLALQHQQGQWQWSASSLQLADHQSRFDLNVAHMQQNKQWQLGAFHEPERERQGWLVAWQHGLWAQPRSKGSIHIEYEHQVGRPKAGGSHWLGELGTHWQAWSALTLSLKYRFQHDLSGYSPLLNNNERRQLHTLHAALDWPWYQSANMYSGLQLYAVQRRSNLPLFAYQDQGVLWVGRYSWPPTSQ